MPSDSLTIFTDGGARGNPGPAASAFVIVNSSGQLLVEQGHFLGSTTNNVAEYQGLILALNWLTGFPGLLSFQHLIFKLDSLLVVNQLKGLYKVKEPSLQILHQRVQSSLLNLKITYQFIHIPRLQNSRADFLVNQTLDN